MSEVKWVDELPVGREGATVSHWPDTLAPLVEQPGRWAEVARKTTVTASSSTASHLRRGGARLPVGTTAAEWEFTSRTDQVTREGVVYARYLGA